MTPKLEEVLRIAREAGRVVLKHYAAAGAPESTTKADGSPLTRADLEADAFIVRSLRGLTPAIPVVSEETGVPPHAERQGWAEFWLVDPLDGTKEFLSRNGEFTVNIALIRGRAPVLGTVFAPAQGLLYFAEEGLGAWKQAQGSEARRIVSKLARPDQPLAVVESRSHGSDRLEEVLRRLQVVRRVPAGSSLKFCVVAEGLADAYPRFGPTMEWDTAAGDCIWRHSAASGRHESPLTYNKPDMRNGDFVIGLSDWRSLLGAR